MSEPTTLNDALAGIEDADLFEAEPGESRLDPDYISEEEVDARAEEIKAEAEPNTFGLDEDALKEINASPGLRALKKSLMAKHNRLMSENSSGINLGRQFAADRAGTIKKLAAANGFEVHEKPQPPDPQLQAIEKARQQLEDEVGVEGREAIDAYIRTTAKAELGPVRDHLTKEVQEKVTANRQKELNAIEEAWVEKHSPTDTEVEAVLKLGQRLRPGSMSGDEWLETLLKVVRSKSGPEKRKQRTRPRKKPDSESAVQELLDASNFDEAWGLAEEQTLQETT